MRNLGGLSSQWCGRLEILKSLGFPLGWVERLDGDGIDTSGLNRFGRSSKTSEPVFSNQLS